MNTYRVEWCELIRAESPEKAAIEALDMMMHDIGELRVGSLQDEPRASIFDIEDHGDETATRSRLGDN